MDATRRSQFFHQCPLTTENDREIRTLASAATQFRVLSHPTGRARQIAQNQRFRCKLAGIGPSRLDYGIFDSVRAMIFCIMSESIPTPDETAAMVPVRRAAEVLGLHPDTVRAMCGDGRLPALDVGTGDRHNWRVSALVLAEIITGERATTQPIPEIQQ